MLCVDVVGFWTSPETWREIAWGIYTFMLGLAWVWWTSRNPK